MNLGFKNSVCLVALWKPNHLIRLLIGLNTFKVVIDFEYGIT